MKKITYKQACEVLSVSMQTIKTAVMRGRLTRCANTTRSALLLLEQVELFKGKQISTRALTADEREKWEEYKRIAETPEWMLTNTLIDKEDINKLVEQKVEERMKPLLQEEYSKLERDENEIREKKERFHKAFPFLRKLIANEQQERYSVV